MPRLILAPQLPIRLRYQEWWHRELRKQYQKYFDSVIVLGAEVEPIRIDQSAFSVADIASRYEMLQVSQYMRLKLHEHDVLLLCDLSYPGYFAHVLWHKRPAKAFAICHASSRNRYDIFAPVRRGKFAVESSTAALFDVVFVASYYHAKKLGWKNAEVIRLPYPPEDLIPMTLAPKEARTMVTVSRKGMQKRTPTLESVAMRALGITDIELPANNVSWTMYYWNLSRYQYLLSTAKEETFGYQIVDAVLCGTIPIAPNRFSYPELLPRSHLYSDAKELADILSRTLSVPRLQCHEDMLQFYHNTARRMMQ